MDMDEKTIIVQTYINLQLAGSLQEYNNSHFNPYDNSPLAEIIRKMRSFAGFDNTAEPYSFLNQGVLLTSLWGLIVYPKEIIEKMVRSQNISEESKRLLDSDLQNITSSWKIPCKIKWNENENNKTLRKFLEKLRNAVSHIEFSINNNEFKFRDNGGFEVVFTVEELFAFLSEFYKFCLSLQPRIQPRSATKG
jgi:hypothetical protein